MVLSGQRTRARSGEVGEAPEDLHVKARASGWPSWQLGWLGREIQAQASSSGWISVEAGVADLQ